MLALVASPVILVFAIGVAVSLRTWPFFVQRRPGWQGRTFTIVKLRTLPTTTPHYALKETLGIEQMPLPWLCAVLRRTHLDELPQLFSVALGQMSLVGPRPLQPAEVEPIAKDFETLRRSVRPGCTGLWQLSVASSANVASAPQYDVFYVNYASTLLDIWIFTRTLGWVFGLVKPIELADVPRRLLGPGMLVESSVHEFASPEVEAEPAGWQRPKVPTREVYPTHLAHGARPLPARDRIFAEVGD